jgi:hypothetical protein
MLTLDGYLKPGRSHHIYPEQMDVDADPFRVASARQIRREVMGMIRKIASVGTLGVVNFWSEKERMTRYTKQRRNAARAQRFVWDALQQSGLLDGPPTLRGRAA